MLTWIIILNNKVASTSTWMTIMVSFGVPRIESPQLRVWEIDFGVYSGRPHISGNSLKTLLYLAEILAGDIQIPSNPRIVGYDTHHIVLYNFPISCTIYKYLDQFSKKKKKAGKVT